MYCTVDNIKNLMADGILGQLVSNDLQIELAIKTASTTIDAYIAGSYPQGVESPFLQEICQKMAIYTLYMLNAADETPSIVSKAYTEAISDLEKLQKGLISLPGGNNPAPLRQGEVFCNKTVDDRIFW